MSAADEDTELRDLLVQTLDKNGVLGKIKAELRASIFIALEAQEQNKNPLKNTKLQKFVANDDGRKCVAIVNDFLDHFNLDYTSAVFGPESNITDSVPSAHNIRESYGIGDNRTPLLAEILKKASSSRSSNAPEILGNQQIQLLRSKFDSFDRDGSGSIDRKDVSAVISLACPLFNPDMLERFVSEELRSEYSSSVTFDVFTTMFRRLHEMCSSVTSVGKQSTLPSIPLTQTTVKSPDKPDSYFIKQSQSFHQVPASPTPMQEPQSSKSFTEGEAVPANYLMPSGTPPQDGSMDVGYDDFFDSKPERRTGRARTADSGYSDIPTNRISSMRDAPPVTPPASSGAASEWPNKKVKTEYGSGSQGYEDDFNSEQSISEEIQDLSNLGDDLLQSSDKDESLDLTEDRTVSEVPHADYMEDIRHG